MTRIGVLGSCQAQSYACAIRALVPAAEVSHFFLNSCEVEEVHAFASDCDLFFTQPVAVPEWGELRTERLPQGNLALLPNVVFTGFHPDITYVGDWGAAHSLMGGYHSALIAACFCLDLPPARVPALFNRYVYEELGYLDEHLRARRFLIESCAEIGIDVAPLIDRWADATSFMHTSNHPTVRVLADIARIGLDAAGLAPIGVADARPEDPLAGVSWPVFDCVAERLEVAADPLFRLPLEATPLPEYVVRSYAAYADADRAVLAQTPSVAKAMATLERIGLR